MPTNRSKSDVSENRTASDSTSGQRPILDAESDALIARLKEVQGDESVSSFSRRCGFRESVFRGYLVEGKKPGLEYLVAIARAANVTVDWLATGRPPKTLAEQRAASQEVAPVAAVKTEGGRVAGEAKGTAINAEALSAILGGILQAMGPGQDYTKAAAKAVEYYQDALKEGLIKPEGIGPGGGQNSA